MATAATGARCSRVSKLARARTYPDLFRRYARARDMSKGARGILPVRAAATGEDCCNNRPNSNKVNLNIARGRKLLPLRANAIAAKQGEPRARVRCPPDLARSHIVSIELLQVCVYRARRSNSAFRCSQRCVCVFARWCRRQATATMTTQANKSLANHDDDLRAGVHVAQAQRALYGLERAVNCARVHTRVGKNVAATACTRENARMRAAIASR